jgi:DNA-binding NarL/FixJ family response regulator
MDINIKPFTGIQATEQIKSQSFSKVIGLSMHSHPSYAKQMLRAGATGYVTKNSSTNEIFTAVREAAKGNKYICSEIKTIISDEMMSNNRDEPSVRSLTEREMQIIHLIRDGLSSKEIATSIGITLKTVEVHRHNILKKLKIKNSSMLVSYMYTNAGLI